MSSPPTDVKKTEAEMRELLDYLESARVGASGKDNECLIGALATLRWCLGIDHGFIGEVIDEHREKLKKHAAN